MYLLKVGDNMNESKETYTIEIADDNIFSKFIKKFTKHKNQKLLTSGNVKVKYTSESISSLWRKTAFKAAVLKRMESFTNLFIRTKHSKKNLIDTLIVKNEEYKKEVEVASPASPLPKEKIIEDTKLSDVAPIIPKAVSKTIKYNAEGKPIEESIEKK